MLITDDVTDDIKRSDVMGWHVEQDAGDASPAMAGAGSPDRSSPLHLQQTRRHYAESPA